MSNYKKKARDNGAAQSAKQKETKEANKKTASNVSDTAADPSADNDIKGAAEKASEKKRKPSALFESDKFMLALSFVIAFFIWAVMSVNTGETGNYPITEIPVTMELSEDAQDSSLSVVSIDGKPVDDFTATVRVRGNSVTVGSLSASDIQVYGANLGNIVASGTYPVTLQARQLGVKNNYDIISVYPSEVKVVVDRTITTEFTIESQINATSPVEYYIGSPSLSQTTVTVTGPEQIVSKAVKAVVSADIEYELQETSTFTSLPVKLFDASGEVVEDDAITLSPNEVDVTIPVLVKKTVPLVPDYLNAPANLNASDLVTVKPNEIEIAAPADIIDSVSSISAGTIDFSTVSSKMAPITNNLVMPEGVKNLNNIESAVVSFDFSDYVTRFFNLSQLDPINTPEGLAVEFSSYNSLKVTVIGPKSEMIDLKADDITASIDLTDAKIGTSVIPVSVSINKPTSCWVYGTYTTNITVKDASEVTSSTASSQ